MKKIILAAVATVMLCAPGLKAQQNRVDVEGFKKKIAKSDAEIADPKKNAKSATWINRGKLFVEIAEAPTRDLFVGQTDNLVMAAYGRPIAAPTNEQIGDNTLRKVEYANITIYYLNQAGVSKAMAWTPKVSVVDSPMKTATEAYLKAYQIDPGAAQKVTEAQKSINNFYRQEANNYSSLAKYADAAESFADAYESYIAAPAKQIDTTSLFNAGLLYAMSDKFEKAIPYLTKALEAGYVNEGDTYFYIFHCYYNLKDYDNAKDIVMKGLAKYPTNSRIVEGLLLVYTTGNSNPEEIIPIVQKTIEADPDNASLYQGMGLIYNKLNKTDLAIEAMKKAVSLAPDDFGMNFNAGLFLAKHGDELNQALGKLTGDEHKEALKKRNDTYAQAIPYLEKALAITPNDKPTVKLLKDLTFILRDEPGMMEKKDKYDAMFKKMEE